MLLATQEPAAGGGVPAELQSTVAQLKNVFAYQGFQMLETAVLRGRPGESVMANGVLSAGKEDSAQYSLSFRPYVQSDDKARSIRIDRLEFSVNRHSVKPQGFQPSTSIAIRSDIDVKEGQKVIVGKTGLEGNQRALILVVTGKIVE
jgi:hypothetical protein